MRWSVRARLGGWTVECTLIANSTDFKMGLNSKRFFHGFSFADLDFINFSILLDRWSSSFAVLEDSSRGPQSTYTLLLKSCLGNPGNSLVKKYFFTGECVPSLLNSQFQILPTTLFSSHSKFRYFPLQIGLDTGPAGGCHPARWPPRWGS